MSISVGHAKAVARQWIIEEAGQADGFSGAFLHGSVNWLPDDAALPATSDLDVMVVMNSAEQIRTGKFVYRDVLLEVSCLPVDRIQSPEQLLSDYQLASSFRTPSIIVDPTGELSAIQVVVSQNFAKREWVRKRCEDVRSKLQHDLQPSHDSGIFADQILAWLFGTGKTAHLLLVAGLKNPTVRRRYAAAQELLRDYGYLEFHHSLLELAGCAHLRKRQVEQHLDALTAVFDTTRSIIRTPFAFASDISMTARPVAIDGSRELIAAGYHREAVFWMAVTYSRCQKVLHHDAPAQVQRRFEPGYQRLLHDLEITSPADLQRRIHTTLELLPRIWAVAEAVLAANPAVED